MFLGTDEITRDILKGLREPTYLCDYGSAGLLTVKVTTVNGALFVTAEPDTAKSVAEEFGVTFTEREVLIVGGRYFLLDNITPEISTAAFKRPETKESVKKRALNKLSKEERAALGL